MAIRRIETYGLAVDGVAPLIDVEEVEIPDEVPPAPSGDLEATVADLQAKLDLALAGLGAATSLAQVRNAAKAAQA